MFTGLKRLRNYCNLSSVESIHLRLTPQHIVRAFPSVPIGTNPLIRPITDVGNALPALRITVALPPTPVLHLIHQQVQLRARQVFDGMKIPLVAKPTTQPAVAATYVQTLSTDLRKDQPALQTMKSFFQHHRQEIFKVKELPAGVSPKATFPSKSELLHRRAFGKHVSCQSYTVEKSFSQIAVLLWKYAFVTEVCTTLV